MASRRPAAAQAGLSRRAFLGRLGISAAALTATPVTRALASPLGGLGLSGTGVDERLLPTPRQIQRQVENMVSFGPRLTGSPAHQLWIDELERQWSAAGLAVTRDRFSFTRWLARSWSLQLLDGPGAGSVPVSSYFPYTAPTGPNGVTAPLVYVGPVPVPSITGNVVDLMTNSWALQRWQAELADDLQASLAAVQGGVAGKIVLLDAPVPPLSAADFAPLLTYSHDDVDHRVPDSYNDYKRIWIVGAFIQYVLQLIEQAGPVGAIFALDASRANAAGQYTPYAQPPFSIPALYVDRDTGTRLRKLAAATPRARLTLTASVAPQTPSDSLVGTLPGDGSADEVMIVNTHTDGQNAFEENGGIALSAVARYFAKLGRSARKRTLVFSAFTGHFGPGLPQAQGFVDRHPDLIARAAASLTVEHFGATEWLDDSRGYYPTGLAELGAIWHSQTPIAVPTVQTMIDDNFKRTSALRPAGDYMVAVGGPFHKAGVPTLSYIAGPNYLVALAPNDHIDKLDARLFQRELVWTVDILQRLDKLPKAALQAGDTTVWAHDNGALNALP
jgi:hypothetical protein